MPGQQAPVKIYNAVYSSVQVHVNDIRLPLAFLTRRL